jgi:anaerobic magnesium-protoporphyrin IX monomethyl ester cyclase
MFSRGCIFECSYCSIKALNDLYHGKGRYFRLRSPAQALEEIKTRVAKYKLEYVRFDDNILNANRKWAAEFLTRYKAEIGIPFQCNMRSGNVDPEAVRLLKEAGCRCVIIGVEHGNDVFRKEVLNRSVTNEKIVDSFSYFSAQGMNCGIQLLVGLPFENRRLFLDTVRLCRQLPLHTHTLSIFSPYPGTALYKVCKEHKWLPDRVDRKERLEAIMSFPGFSREDIQLCFDMFPHLLKHKNIPLFVPLEWVRHYVKVIERWTRPKA